MLIQDLGELRRRLAPHLQRAAKAILFGSAARGEADEWSDLDLVIVAETNRPFLERFRDFEGLYDVWPRLDLLIYTPGEFARMRAEGNALIDQILAEGVLIHEAAALKRGAGSIRPRAIRGSLISALVRATIRRPASCHSRRPQRRLRPCTTWAAAVSFWGTRLVELLGSLVARYPSVAALRDGARQLDQYYVPTRYPNGLPGGTPAEVFSKTQAEQAVAYARRFVQEARALVETAGN